MVMPDFTGERARFLQFQGGQLLLRQQIQALTELWQLPNKLQVHTSAICHLPCS